jgi:DNA-binding winged helix-turn-helix (wHTH) protein
VLVAIIGGQTKDEEHLARIAASGGHQLEFYRAGPPGNDVGPRALVFEALDRADLAVGALRALRQDPYFDTMGALIALNASPAGCELPGDFDDFVFHPYTREELQIRLRALERRRPAAGDVRLGFGRAPARSEPIAGILVEEVSRTLSLEGRAVQLTAREFALFTHLCEWRGRVLSREHLLTRVWGSRYSGGRRTVDIHVRRLRAKLGDALPIETVRGAGYRLRSGAEAPASDATVSDDQPISSAVRLPTRSSPS